MNLEGAVEAFTELLSSPDENCREQATWAVGNLAGESPENRDVFLAINVVPLLCAIIDNKRESLAVLKNAVWCLGNLCRRNIRFPDFELVVEAIPRLCAMLSIDDEEVAQDAAWGLSYLSDAAGPGRIEKVLEHKPIEQLISFCGSSNTSLVTPALRTLGTFLTGSDATTQQVLNCGFLNVVPFLLAHRKRGIRKETCWALSNVTAGTRSQVDMFIASNVMPPLLDLMSATEHEVQKEAVWAVCNFTAGATPVQNAYLVDRGGMSKMVAVLRGTPQSVLLPVLLESLGAILAPVEQRKETSGAEHNELAVEMCQNGGLTAINQLLGNADQAVADLAISLVETYFDGLEDEGDLSEQPN